MCCYIGSKTKIHNKTQTEHEKRLSLTNNHKLWRSPKTRCEKLTNDDDGEENDDDDDDDGVALKVTSGNNTHLAVKETPTINCHEIKYTVNVAYRTQSKGRLLVLVLMRKNCLAAGYTDCALTPDSFDNDEYFRHTSACCLSGISLTSDVYIQFRIISDEITAGGKPTNSLTKQSPP